MKLQCFFVVQRNSSTVQNKDMDFLLVLRKLAATSSAQCVVQLVPADMARGGGSGQNIPHLFGPGTPALISVERVVKIRYSWSNSVI
jgi:hypothetical protein